MNTLLFYINANEITRRNSAVWPKGVCVNTLVCWFWMNWVLQNLSFRAPCCTSINCTAWPFKVLTSKTYQMPYYYFHSNFQQFIFPLLQFQRYYLEILIHSVSSLPFVCYRSFLLRPSFECENTSVASCQISRKDWKAKTCCWYPLPAPKSISFKEMETFISFLNLFQGSKMVHFSTKTEALYFYLQKSWAESSPPQLHYITAACLCECQCSTCCKEKYIYYG